jgi:hypothetical protein
MFEENSDDAGIRKAMTEARRRKYALMAQSGNPQGAANSNG